MTELGLHALANDPNGWWHRVEDEMEAFVSAHVPPHAAGVEIALDAERLEVVLAYDLASHRVRRSARRRSTG